MRRALITADAVGGVWTYAATLARGLRAEGWEATIAVLGPPPSAARRDEADARVIVTGLPLDWAANDRAGSLAAARALARLAADERCDVVHLNSPLLAAGADWSRPTLAMAHGCLATWWAAVRGDAPLDPAYAWQRDLTARGLRAATIVAAPSAAFAAALRAAYGLARPIAVVRNGAGEASASPEKTSSFPRKQEAISGLHPRTPAREMDPRLRGDDDDIGGEGGAIAAAPAAYALTAGRLWDEAKDAALLDAAAGLLAAPLRAAGATRGPGGEAFAGRHLDLLGELPAAALAALLAERPVFVSAARFEPFGLAVLEAARAGCALVLSDIAAFRELWDGAAVFVAGRDPRAWAEALDALLADPAARGHWGERARTRSARYSAAAMARETARLYARALATSVAA